MAREFSSREQKMMLELSELIEYIEQRFGVVVTVNDAQPDQRVSYHLHVAGECMPETIVSGFDTVSAAAIAGLEKVVVPASKFADRAADLPLPRRRTIAA